MKKSYLFFDSPSSLNLSVIEAFLSTDYYFTRLSVDVNVKDSINGRSVMAKRYAALSALVHVWETRLHAGTVKVSLSFQ